MEARLAEAGPDETVIVTAVANVPAVAEPLNPVGAILDALPEQILASRTPVERRQYRWRITF